MTMKTTQESPTGQPQPPAPGRLARDVVRDLWRALTPLIVFEVVFKAVVLLLGALGAGWVMAPLIGFLNRPLLARKPVKDLFEFRF